MTVADRIFQPDPSLEISGSTACDDSRAVGQSQADCVAKINLNSDWRKPDRLPSVALDLLEARWSTIPPPVIGVMAIDSNVVPLDIFWKSDAFHQFAIWYGRSGFHRKR